VKENGFRQHKSKEKAGYEQGLYHRSCEKKSGIREMIKGQDEKRDVSDGKGKIELIAVRRVSGRGVGFPLGERKNG